MDKLKVSLFLFLIAFGLQAQNSVSIQLGYSVGNINVKPTNTTVNIYSTDKTQGYSADFLFYVHDFFQFEAGIAYSSLNYSYIYQNNQDYYRVTNYNAYADVYAKNSILSFPFGGSFVLPLKNSKFLIGAKIIPNSVSTNNKGYFISSGTKRVNSDSSYHFENYFVDNEIGLTTSSHTKFQFHIGYQYQFKNGIGFSLRYEMTPAKTSNFTSSFHLNTLRFGFVFRIIDYDKVRARMEQQH